ncbi:MAG TPA: Hpt domain-containing protein [Casimicrobiaceae bacterium]|nr:Hpt domain-containing protein [Casimicrobiaceae bacterium]
MADDAIDTSTFRSLEEAAGATFVSELAGTFLDEAPRMLKALDAALAARDAEALRRTAHSLKSNALTFGAIRLAGLARELEQSAIDTVARGERVALDTLASEYQRVATAITELRNA